MEQRRTRPEPPPLVPDPVIDAYKPGIDCTLIRENLRLSSEERVMELVRLLGFVEAIRGSAWRARDD